MANFGHYVTVRELRRTGLTVIYSGRAAPSSAERFAIKVLEPSVLFVDKEREKTRAHQFLNTAGLQQKVVAGGAQYWAPIHEHGSTTAGTFYVTDKYDRSLQELIEGQVGLAAKALCAIIGPVAEGLIELKKACQRPHGNLKATNVLIAGVGASSEMKVALSDPLPDEYVDAKVHWQADLRAIGEFVYQLVVRRPAPSLESGQIPDSREWDRLGRYAKGWRDLCGRLLAARAKPGAVTLESLIEEIAELSRTKPVLSHPQIAVLVGLLVAGTLVVLLCGILKDRGRQPAEPNDWRELCSYYYFDWVGPLYTGLGYTRDSRTYDRSTRAKDWFKKDPDLARIVGENREDLNSRIWCAGYPERAAEPGKDVQYIMENPGDKKETDKALLAIRYIESFLDIESANDSNALCKPWPMLKEVREAANSFETGDWLKPAALYLEGLVKLVKPPSDEIVRGANEILDLKTENVLDQIRLLQNNINGYKNRDYTWAQVYNELLQEVQNRFANTLVSEQTFQNWLHLVEDYREMADEEHPRTSEKWSVTIDSNKAAIQLIRGYEPNSAYKLAKDLEGFEEKAKSGLAIPGIEKYRDSITDKVNQLNSEYSALGGRIQEIWNRYVEPPEIWWKDREIENEITASKAINSEWLRRRDLELENCRHLLPDWKDKKKLGDFVNLKHKVDMARQRLQGLDNVLPPQIDGPLDSGGWKENLAGVYKQAREEKLQQITRWIELQDEVPDVNASIFRTKWETPVQDFENWRDKLRQAMSAFDEIEQYLNACYLLDEKSPKKPGTIRSLWNNWKDSDILKEPKITHALQGLTNRVKKLIAIAEYDDSGKLARMVLDPNSHTEAVYAAWLRLGEFPPWPSTEEELEQDEQIQTKLDFTGITDASRRKVLQSQLQTVSRIRQIVFLMQRVSTLKESLEDSLEKIRNKGRGKSGNLYGIFDIFLQEAKKTPCFRDQRHDPDPSELSGEKPQELARVEQELRTCRNNLREFAEPANKLAKFLNASEWNDEKKYDKQKFCDEMLAQLTKQRELIDWGKTIDGWTKAFSDYLGKPDYCKHLELDDGKLVFAPTTTLWNNFEPISPSPNIAAGWDEIRQAIKEKDKKWRDFFYAIDVSDNLNVGWPQYIRSSRRDKDASVIFTFVPAGGGNPEPFYMSTHEITNAQYQFFLQEFEARPMARPNQKRFGRDGKVFLSWTRAEDLPCPIAWNGQTFVLDDASRAKTPVTYVTYDGAYWYARWLGARLPGVFEHKHACWANTTSRYPWGEDLSSILSYAHVRAGLWRDAAEAYNRLKDNPDASPPVPVGAVTLTKTNFKRYETELKVEIFPDEETTYPSFWPIASQTTPNDWYLHDMIGNVWEWCQDRFICGGSCLAPPEYITDMSKYSVRFNKPDGKANDVGFRVVVPASTVKKAQF